MNSFSCGIEQNHIDKGVKNDPELCPIARALMDRGLSHVCVNGAMAKFSDGDGRWQAFLPDEAREFVVRFDAGGRVRPFEFKVKPLPVRG